ncbi:ATP-binding protein [Streptomyces sp. NPDC051976]|uniref:ATP-binding protein n=1 Tax=Streptomyces sp. NPDC051976 TaxID=3154947 RepID=UPI003443666A
MTPTLVNVERDDSLRVPLPRSLDTARGRPAYSSLDASAPWSGTSFALHAAITVSAETQWVRTVRRFTSAVLSRWAVVGDDLDTSLLIVSELAGNSAQHGRADLAVLLSLKDHTLSITVVDSGEATEHAPEPTSSAGYEHGRGLDIVAALADRCETLPKSSGWQTRACVRVATVR